MKPEIAKVGVVGSNPIARSNKIKTLADFQDPACGACDNTMITKPLFDQTFRLLRGAR